jgi:hypothetical protein
MKLIFCFLLYVLAFESKAFVPSEAYTFDFNIKTLKMTRLKEHKLYSAVEILRQVFASPEFKQKILHHRFREKKSFHLNKNLSNLEIYNQILAGVERLYPYDNNAMDVEIELYSDFKSNVLGFTMPKTKRIWMNIKYFNKHSPAEVAAHLTHEWLHKLGFGHERERSRDRRFSVPYAVGYIVKELARDYE